jgi:hypothetical protein
MEGELMKRKLLAVSGVLVLLASLLVAAPVGAGREDVDLPIPVDIDDVLKEMPVPAQPSPAEAAAIALSGETTASQCFGNDLSLTYNLPSWDPDNPGSEDVVFWKETSAGSTGKATLWVAWDTLTYPDGRVDVITCDQLAYMQSMMDSIVDTDVYYFGEYDQRPAGNENIDVMIYNIVDESYYAADFPFYIAGFFWGGLNDLEDRNMIFIDTLDWENRTGPDAIRPYLYEGTVAHELQHLIHNDHDPGELSWVEEGLSDLSEYLNGFGHSDSHVVYYLAFHRTSLTVWGGGLEDYGASYLFQLYLLENFGQRAVAGPYEWDNAWTRELCNDPRTGIEGIEGLTGRDMNALYDAWILANYLDDPSLTSADNLPLGYEEIDLAPFTSRAYSPWSIARSIEDTYGSDHHGNLPVSRYWGGYRSGTVEYPLGALPPYAPLYGTYKGMQPEMDVFLRGQAQSGVEPAEGVYEMASGSGNMLTDRMLALYVPVGGTLTFQTWFHIEKDWDFGFVEASTDGGTTWAPLVGNITRYSDNPFGSTAWDNSLVSGQADTDAAITGNSGGWVDAAFALPAASDVLIRFSYYTDEAYNDPGWFVDDVSVNGFSDGFETGTADWDVGGWTRTTGLFDNDWSAAYVNPVYDRGKFDYLDYGYWHDGLACTDANGDPAECILGVVDTARLNRESATVVISNRPAESPFEANYLLLIEKGDASD